MSKLNDLIIPDSNDCILLDDSGTDQCIINLNSFQVFSTTGIYFDVGGATNDMSSAQPLELVDEAYTLATMEDGQKVIFQVNQAFCNTDLSQREALMLTYQVHNHGISIDNCAKWHIHINAPLVLSSVILHLKENLNSILK